MHALRHAATRERIVHERQLVRVLVIVPLGVVLVQAQGAVGEVPGNAVGLGTEHERLSASLDERRVAPALDVPVACGFVER